jgi:hypothetical protein
LEQRRACRPVALLQDLVDAGRHGRLAIEQPALGIEQDVVGNILLRDAQMFPICPDEKTPALDEPSAKCAVTPSESSS